VRKAAGGAAGRVNVLLHPSIPHALRPGGRPAVIASSTIRKRRRRLPEHSPSPAVVRTSVCEGCGDCSRASNCLPAGPLETGSGRNARSIKPRATGPARERLADKPERPLGFRLLARLLPDVLYQPSELLTALASSPRRRGPIFLQASALFIRRFPLPRE
jgi:hypothetical protein